MKLFCMKQETNSVKLDRKCKQELQNFTVRWEINLPQVTVCRYECKIKHECVKTTYKYSPVFRF